jgi:hypothetical protein
MLIDLYLPFYDVTQIVEVDVDAPPVETYRAIRDTDLRDPVVSALFAIRELPLRVARWWRNTPAPPASGPVTFGQITTEGPGFTLLAEHPDHEFVVGSVGKFWRCDYEGRRITGEQFVPFREPGFAKLAISLGVRPSRTGGTVLRYEARTATTDETAKRIFRRYWRLIHPGVAMVMRRALMRIKREAERRSAHTLVTA